MGHYFEMSSGHHGYTRELRDFSSATKNCTAHLWHSKKCVMGIVIIMFLFGPYQTTKTKRALIRKNCRIHETLQREYML